MLFLLAGLHIGMAVMAALLMVVVLALIFLCVKKCYIRRRRRRKNCSKNIIFGTNQLTFLSDVERELEKKKKRDEVRYDPLEFPREQLFLSGELLGMYGILTSLILYHYFIFQVSNAIN